MISRYHSDFSKNPFLPSSILNDDDFDVIMQVGEDHNIKEFHAHSSILQARSPYFKCAFSTNWIVKENNMIRFNKPNVAPTVFEMILEYIYTGELDLTKRSNQDIIGLLIASDELLLEELLKYIQDHLVEKHADWVQQNFVLVLNTVFKLDVYKKLQDYCLELICTDPQSFIPLLDDDMLFGLLEMDDLQIEEIVIWDCLIKWGIRQISGLESNHVNEFSTLRSWKMYFYVKENYKDLENTLRKFIPLIRFFDISSENFRDGIQPYKQLVPHEIFDEIRSYHLKGILPKTISLVPRMKLLESTIIQPRLATIISNWIDGKNSCVLSFNNRYKFDLIYKKSRDGFNSKIFHDQCYKQGPFIVLIKVQSNKIYGGYNPIGYGYDGKRQMTSLNSFVFSFEHDQDIRDMKIGRVINKDRAIYEDRHHSLFNFGGNLRIYESDIPKLFLGNFKNYENVFNLESCDGYNDLAKGVYLIAEEVEAFSITERS